MNVNRRSFLLGTAAAASAYGQAGEHIAIGVIGTGGRGSFLLGGVLAQPDTKVAALCDIKPDRVERAAALAARDNPATYAEWRRVIDRKDVDAVYIATPPYLHPEMAVAALQADKHVYCEKPVGITAAGVRHVVRAARASNRVFVAGQQLRSMKQYVEAVGKIHGGIIGDLIMIKAQREANADLDHNGTSADWYFDVAKGGGYLIEQSVHNLDVCNGTAGSHPVRASGFGGIGLYKNDPPGRTIFDHGCLIYEYANGVKMEFTQNVFHPRSMPAGDQYVRAYGTKGAADVMGNSMLYPPERNAQPSTFAARQEEDQHAHTRMFLDCITKGAKPVAGIVDGATAALTAILGHEAMVTGKMTYWKDFEVDV